LWKTKELVLLKEELRIKLVEGIVRDMERQLAEVKRLGCKHEDFTAYLTGAEAYIIDARHFGSAIELAKECYENFQRYRDYALDVYHANR
jgi:hypothetical protein